MKQNLKLPEFDSYNIYIIDNGCVNFPLSMGFDHKKYRTKSNMKLDRKVVAFNIKKKRISQLRKGIDNTKDWQNLPYPDSLIFDTKDFISKKLNPIRI